MVKYYYAIASFLILLLGCQGPGQQNLKQICFDSGFLQPIEIVSLKNIQEIKHLEGKFVKMEGIFRYRFEDVGLYPSKTAKAQEAMWVNIKIPSYVPNEELQELDQKKVSVIGRVNLNDKGHFNSYLGSLDSAFCIKER